MKEHVALLEMRWRLAPTESCPNPGTITQMHSLGFDQFLDGTLPLDELAVGICDTMLRRADEAMEQENARVKALLFRAKVLEITGWQEGDCASLTLHQRINRLFNKSSAGSSIFVRTYEASKQCTDHTRCLSRMRLTRIFSR